MCSIVPVNSTRTRAATRSKGGADRSATESHTILSKENWCGERPILGQNPRLIPSAKLLSKNADSETFLSHVSRFGHIMSVDLDTSCQSIWTHHVSRFGHIMSVDLGTSCQSIWAHHVSRFGHNMSVDLDTSCQLIWTQ